MATANLSTYRAREDKRALGAPEMARIAAELTLTRQRHPRHLPQNLRSHRAHRLCSSPPRPPAPGSGGGAPGGGGARGAPTTSRCLTRCLQVRRDDATRTRRVRVADHTHRAVASAPPLAPPGAPQFAPANAQAFDQPRGGLPQPQPRLAAVAAAGNGGGVAAWQHGGGAAGAAAAVTAAGGHIARLEATVQVRP